MVLAAEAGRARACGAVSAAARRAAAAPDAAGRALDGEQAAAVGHLTGPGLVRTLVAPAGAGKTFVLAQAVRAWQHDGRQVVLMAHQGKAADVAAAEISRAAGASVPAMTLARAFGTDDAGPGEDARRWRARLAAQARTQGAVLLVDEAGVVDTAMLRRVLSWAADYEVAVRLVGDPRQQQAIGAGGMLGYLARDPQLCAELGSVRRFTHPEEGAASIGVRAGDGGAVDFYAAPGPDPAGGQPGRGGAGGGRGRRRRPGGRPRRARGHRHRRAAGRGRRGRPSARRRRAGRRRPDPADAHLRAGGGGGGRTGPGPPQRLRAGRQRGRGAAQRQRVAGAGGRRRGGARRPRRRPGRADPAAGRLRARPRRTRLRDHRVPGAGPDV